MHNHGCINRSLDGVNYSSPVPIIGLYIVAGSLACMLLMLYDVVVGGILAKKKWLPCKCFEHNSITLTLLPIASKLPVDFTTLMPQRQDHLSKFTGTAIICISMGFVTPSLGIALSIFVVIVVVNICIQLRTGVIVLFFVEHIIILSLMLLFLLMFCYIALYVNITKGIQRDLYQQHLSTGFRSMLEQLKACSLHAYFSNPQYKISMHPMNGAVSIMSGVLRYYSRSDY